MERLEAAWEEEFLDHGRRHDRGMDGPDSDGI
jgi:hypothetical protein